MNSRNHPVVVAAIGFADPLSCAELEVTLFAAPVVTAGGAGVVNDRTLPSAVPDGFDVIAQK